MDTLKKTEVTTKEEILDHFSYTVAYVKDGRVELADITRVIDVKKGSNFATDKNMRKLVKDIEVQCVEEGGANPYELDFEYIYRGCKRFLHIKGEKAKLLMQT